MTHPFALKRNDVTAPHYTCEGSNLRTGMKHVSGGPFISVSLEKEAEAKVAEA